MFKYELGQLVYYLLDNKLHSAKVLSRMKLERLDESKNNDPYDPYDNFDYDSGTFYATCHGTFREDEIFGSKEELAQNIINS